MRTSALAAIGAICASFLGADLAQAQATRTWVSGVGDDANPCSRTAPCKTFPGAISKTAAGGIIMCLDPGGFGAVTILKSITIECVGQASGVLASGTNGVNVNIPGGVVILRNFAIEGNGSGLVGVNVLAAASVQLDNMHIYGFRSNNATGVRVATSAATEVSISNSIIADNGAGTATGGGVVVVPTGAGGAANVELDRTIVRNNSVGVIADGSGATSTAGLKVILRGSSVSGSTGNGVHAKSTAAGAVSRITLRDVGILSNAANGLLGDGTNKASITVGQSLITNNLTGISQTGGGAVFSYGNNMVHNNNTNGTFDAGGPSQQ